MAPSVPAPVRRVSERVLPWVALAFEAGLLLQVYLAGRATLAGAVWRDHVAFGHALSLPAALAVLLAYLGPFPTRVRRLAWLTIATYYATIALAALRFSDTFGALAPLHPVLAVAAVVLGGLLYAESKGVRFVRGGDDDARAEAASQPEA